MSPLARRLLVAATLAGGPSALLPACPSGAASPGAASSAAAEGAAPPARDAGGRADADDARASGDAGAVNVDAAARAPGPYELPFLGKRTVYFAVPPAAPSPRRLIANLHGVCNPPGYACGYWVHAGSERGFLVCPTGNATCGPSMASAPTWTEPFERMDEDLEKAIATVADAYPGEVGRDGAVLTGFSRGGYAAVRLAQLHPGRWPYLLVTEADVSLSAPLLRAWGVRAVALVAGEIGGQIAGERKTAEALARQGFPARLWAMPKAGHYYSANIDAIMGEAIDWMLANGETDGGAK